MQVFIGIDPGINGGLAAVRQFDRIAACGYPCPATLADMEFVLYNLCHSVRADDPLAVIERAQSFPGQGVASTFKFGKNYGEWLGLLTALKIPFKIVSPSVWMKHFGAMPKERTPRKNHLKGLAQQRHPDLKIILKTADAVLLADYAREVAWR